jgi:glycosyltransferase involved in cell wall biosynthesis
MRTALIIAYYWPPAGGVGVYRAVKFCKYLPKYGWRPLVLTVRNGTYSTLAPPSNEDTAQVEVVRTRSVEPHGVYNAVEGTWSRIRKQKSAEPELAHVNNTFFRAADFVRTNLFVPDARIGWFPFAFRRGLQLVKRYEPSVIFSTAPPYTTHLVGRALQRCTRMPWVADFRDPWLEHTVYNKYYRLPPVVEANRRLERGVLTHADRVLTVGPHLQQLLSTKVPDLQHKFSIISNGFDRDDVVSNPSAKASDRFEVSYYGSLYAERLPQVLLKAIADLSLEDPHFGEDVLLRIRGEVFPGAYRIIERALKVGSFVIKPSLPLQEAYQDMARPQLLWLTIEQMAHNEIIVLGKTFDYLASGNPIIGIGPPHGDAANVLRKTGAGEMVGYDDLPGVKRLLRSHFQAWQTGTTRGGNTRCEQYSRERLTAKLAGVFDELCAQRPTRG